MKSVKKKHITIIAGILIIAVAALAAILLWLYPVNKIKDMRHLTQDDYNSIFVSMYPIEHFSQESFQSYRGLDTYIASHNARSIKELTDYIHKALQSGNTVSTIYIGLDPYMLYSDAIQSDVDMAAEMSGLFDCIISNPGVTFEILLPALPMSEWTAMSAEETKDVLTSYYYAIACMEPHSNALCFFFGDEEWLIRNQSNYTASSTFNKLISDKILCSAFCDRAGQTNLSNAEAKFTALYDMIITEQTNPSIYPDWSDKTIVFFGDSILGLQYGSYSVPGVINSLTGADVYNYAIGGTTACDADPSGNADHSFTDRLDTFLNKNEMLTGDGTQFPYNDYASDSSKLIFVINYGYNDYKQQQGVTLFTETLGEEISLLQEAYPEAAILVMVPYECVYSFGGVASTNDAGESLSDYAQAVKETSTGKNTLILDIPSLLAEEVNEMNFKEYFNDECHYSEYGRFYLAEQIIGALE
ncbi:MAG: SGNH/GDSL hydrolase family protein [Lachnospiraceae bacterium]|nr:SGNH/GDSL hydrolase family protein [Lachnospiraceae bacterium]